MGPHVVRIEPDRLGKFFHRFRAVIHSQRSEPNQIVHVRQPRKLGLTLSKFGEIIKIRRLLQLGLLDISQSGKQALSFL
jgi:hypothetical protein